MGEVIGKRTAAVLYAEGGDPGMYEAPAAYVKALGLNLKIKNSGKPADVGQLKLHEARLLLWLAHISIWRSDCGSIQAEPSSG